jgi:phosphomannomutase
MSIKFGTDGWRAVIADEFTFENLKKISLATAIAFRDHPKIKNGIIIGYDTRFLSKEFAECAAAVFANQGIKVFITDSFVTTPAVSLLTRDKNLPFGVMITSSHNPPIYNGYKLKDEYGGSMGVEQLILIEDIMNKGLPANVHAASFETLLNKKCIEYISGRKYYIDNLKDKINIDSITSSGLKIIYDAMYGSGQGILDTLIKVKSIRSEVNPSFGNSNPEPVLKNLAIISNELKKNSYDIGIATDGDADRVAILDERGNFIDAQKTFALMLIYLIEEKGMTGGVVRGFSSSNLIKKICDSYHLKLYTVKIGFKYISELMVSKDILIGAEESGGIGIKNHLPERDGIFNGLLFCEMLSANKKKISELIYDIDSRFGKYFYKRIDKHLNATQSKEELIQAVKKINEIAGMKILDYNDLDGCKLFFEGGWLLVRPSGTEPLLRIYTETLGEDKTDIILKDIVTKLNLVS